MGRTKGAKNKHPTVEERVTFRLSGELLEKMDTLARIHGQNRSETLLESVRDYVRKNQWELDRLEEKK